MIKLFLLSLAFCLSAHGALPKRSTLKQIYLNDTACKKARKSDPTTDCSVVDFKLNKYLNQADLENHLLFLVDEISELNITPVTNPGGNLGEYGTRLVSRVTGNTAGTFPTTLSSDIVLISNNFIGRTSQADPQITKITVGGRDYTLGEQGSAATLGTATLYNQQISGGLPTTGDWENVVIHYEDGTVQPQEYEQKKVAWSDLKGTISTGATGPQGPAGATGPAGKDGSELVELDTLPTDLSPYVNGQILRIKTPGDGRWMAIAGADAGELHSFQTTFQADGNNPAQQNWVAGTTTLNYGYSSFGDIFGSLSTADGGKPLNASNTPIMRLEIELDLTSITPRAGQDSLYDFDSSLTLLIRKSDLTSAPNNLWVRFYTGEPANNNQIDTVEFVKGTDNPAHTYHTYTEKTGTSFTTDTADILSIKYFNLFTASPPTGDQTSNPLALHEAKTATEFDIPAAPWARRGQTAPTGGGGVSSTPRRVTALPAEASSNEGEWVWLSADYTKATGFDISPQNFFNTEIGSEGYGNRGWYSDPQLGYAVGRLSPDDSEIEDIYLISDTTILVKDGTLADLTHIAYGSTECGLTRTDQTNVAVSGPDQRSVDIYKIASGCVPAGDWDLVRLKRTGGSYIPAQVTISKGLYEYLNSDWVEASFYAPAIQPDKDFKISIEEDRPGTRQDKNLNFVASGSTFTTTNPFSKILRITYNNLSTDTDTYRRYTVFVPLAGFEEANAPQVLDTGTVNYSLSYFETDAGQALYITPLVKSSERISSAGTKNGFNVQFKSGQWAGTTGDTKVLRTLNKSQLQTIANAVLGVHTPPTKPPEGTRIELLNDFTIQGGAVLTSAESSGTSSQGVNITGLFTGYEEDSSYDNGTAGGDLGFLNPKNTKILGLVSFSNARAAGNQANKTMFIFPTGQKPRNVWINGKQYSCGVLVDNHFCQVGSLDGSFLKNGEQYYINADNSSGVKYYDDRVLKRGEVYLWTGIQWIKQIRGLAESEVDNRIKAQVPRQFRSDADSTGGLFQPAEWFFGTASEVTAKTKVQYGIYATEKVAQ